MKIGIGAIPLPLTLSMPVESPSMPPTNWPLPVSMTSPNGSGVTGEPGGSVDSTRLRSESALIEVPA
jgi:hypothetical protein